MAFSPLSPRNSAANSSKFAEYELRYRFCQLFPHGWDFLLKETPKSNWKTIKKFKLTEQKCWYKYSDSEQILGVRFGNKTRYGLYDIDWGSIHDPREQEKSLQLLKEQLELYGIICFVLLQSSFNQGLHLYFFLDRPVNTFRLACVMNKAAAEANLAIKRGQLETFPNTKRYNSLYNGHRLPLQQGSYLLDKDYIPYSDRLEHLLDAADWSAARNDTDLLESRLEEAYEWFKAKKNQERIYNPTPEDQDFIEQVDYAQREIQEGFLNQIRISVEQGFTGNGETNELLLTIAKLGRILHGLSGQQYIDYIKETVISCPGYANYCHHKHEIERRCTEVAQYGEKQWYPYRSRLPKDRPSHKYIKESLTNKTNLNLERQHNARNRIIQAVEYIEQQQGALPRKVGERKLAIRNFTKEVFGISVGDRTLHKQENLPLWHPQHRQLGSDSVPESKQPVVENIQSKNINELNIYFEGLKTADISQELNKKCAIQNSLQAQPPDCKQHKDCATLLHVVRPQTQNAETSKALSNQLFQSLCYTLPYMKGMSNYFLIEIFFKLFQQLELLIESQKIILETVEKKGNNRNSNLEDITKTYVQKSAENRSKRDKKSFSGSQKRYYQDFLDRHSDWKASDEERRNPEYQKGMKKLFAEVKEILKGKSRKSNFERQDE